MKTNDIIKAAHQAESQCEYQEETVEVLKRPVGTEPIAPYSAYGIGYMEGMFACRRQLQKEVYDNLRLLTSLDEVEINDIIELMDE